MVLIFDYKRIGKRFLPIIPLRVYGKKRVIETEAYVDSGASIPIFHTAIAELAGIDYERGKIVYPKGTAGHIKAFKLQVGIGIGEDRFKCNALFSKEMITRFNLLGLEGIFDQFKVTFDNKNKKTIFEEY